MYVYTDQEAYPGAGCNLVPRSVEVANLDWMNLTQTQWDYLANNSHFKVMR